jgi:hypothetical protein
MEWRLHSSNQLNCERAAALIKSARKGQRPP